MSIVFLDCVGLWKMASEVWVQVLVSVPDSLLCRIVRHVMQCCSPNAMKLQVSSASRGAYSLPFTCIKDEIPVVTLVLILVPFEMLVGHLRGSSVVKVERGTGCLSLVLVVHVRRLSVTCDVFACYFVVALLWLCRGHLGVLGPKTVAFSYIYIYIYAFIFFFCGPCFGQISRLLPLVKSSDHSRPVGDAILNKRCAAMAAMPD